MDITRTSDKPVMSTRDESGKRKRKQPVRYSPPPSVAKKKNSDGAKRTRRKSSEDSPEINKKNEGSDDEQRGAKRLKRDVEIKDRDDLESPKISLDNIKLIYNIPTIKTPSVQTKTPMTKSPSKPRPKFRSFNEVSSSGDNKKSIFSSDTSISDAVALSSDINKRTNEASAASLKKKFTRFVSIRYGTTDEKSICRGDVDKTDDSVPAAESKKIEKSNKKIAPVLKSKSTDSDGKSIEESKKIDKSSVDIEKNADEKSISIEESKKNDGSTKSNKLAPVSPSKSTDSSVDSKTIVDEKSILIDKSTHSEKLASVSRSKSSKKITDEKSILIEESKKIDKSTDPSENPEKNDDAATVSTTKSKKITSHSPDSSVGPEKIPDEKSTLIDESKKIDDPETVSNLDKSTRKIQKIDNQKLPVRNDGPSRATNVDIKKPKTSIRAIKSESFDDDVSNSSIVDETSSESVIVLDDDENRSDDVIEDDSDDEPSSSIRRYSPKKKYRPLRMNRKASGDCVVTHNVKTDDINRIHITLATTQQEKNLSFTKELFTSPTIDTSKMTYRVMKRANFIIQMVRQEKVIVDLTKLMKLIREDERGEGQKTSIDKKSLMRLIIKLSKDGYIKFRKATLKSDFKEKIVCFICHPDIEDDHSIIMSALDQAKMKFFIHTKGKCQNIIEEKDLPKNVAKDVSTYTTECPKKSKKSKRFDYDSDDNPRGKQKVSYEYDRNASKNYGYTPKVLRTRIIHELLFYLIYDYSTHVPICERDRTDQFFRDHGVLDDVFETDRFSPIYNNEIGWKLFIPPLPKHNGYPDGWTLICDVLLRLPVLIFTKCFNIPYLIPELESYLNHPIKKYFLVKNLPPEVRNGLMHGRRYIFNMHEIMVRLCHMGLLQFGPQKLKEKDQMFIYLNRKASLLDTVKSPPGYHQVADIPYEKRSYAFDTEKDIEKFWYELWTICINTNLGLRNYLVGQYIVVEQPATKPSLLNSTRPKLPEEVIGCDTGDIPGDHRGAAGLDSALFVHLKRNWNWSDLLSYSAKQIADTKLQFDNKTESESDQETTKNPTKHPKTPERIKQKPKKTTKTKKPKPPEKDTIELEDLERSIKHLETDETKPKKIIDNLKLAARVHKLRFRQLNQRKRVIRQILPRKIQRNKKPLYDETDKICITRMSKNRIDWTQVEDNVLMLCSVADRYLCPNRRRQTIEYTTMRDVLHKILPFSNDKTSRACQRRINYTMKNSRTRRSVQMCLEEIKQCEFVQAKFGAICKKYHGVLIPPLTLNIAFVELVQYMNVKFSNQLPSCKNKSKLEVPDDIEELRQKFDVSTHMKRVQKIFGDVENRNDIHMDVIRSVIHSSMACTKDKTSWSWQLFQIYQQYPENLLRSVISKVRHDQMMSVKKSFARAQSHGGGCIPLSSSPFQLSINYVHQLQTNKYHYDMYNEANNFLKDVLNWTGQIENRTEPIDDTIEEIVEKSDEKKHIGESQKKIFVRFENIEGARRENFEKALVDQNIEEARKEIEARNELRKKIKKIEPKRNRKEILNADNGITMLILNVMQKLGLDFHFEHPDEVIILDPSIQDDKFYEDVISRYMEIIKNPNDIPSWEDNTEDPEIELDPAPNPFVLKQRASTRIAFHMMRAQMSEGIDKNSAQHIHDYFVVNASRVFLKTPNNHSGNFNLKILRNELNIDEITETFRLNAIVPEKYTNITRKGVEDYFGRVIDSDLEYIEKVKCFIWSCGEIGSTVEHLQTIKADTKDINIDLLDVINLLIDFRIVFKVGVAVLRFVHFDHKTAWIVKSDKIVRLEKEKLASNPRSSSKWKGKNIISYGENSMGDRNKIRLLIAPWIRLDGTLNRRVLDRWIGSILSTCLEEPGISLVELTSRYDFLKPTEMMQIIELLTKLKCLRTIKVCKPKVSLFSEELDYDVKEASVLDDPKNVLIDPEADAAYNFALFIGQKNYTLNFFN